MCRGPVRPSHDRMVALVERMLELNKRRGGLGPPAARSQTGAQRTPLPPEAELPHSKGCRSALQLSCRGLFIPWPKTHDHENPQRLCRPEGRRYSQTARRKQSFRTPNVANSRRPRRLGS